MSADLIQKLNSLAVFYNIRQDPVIKALIKALEAQKSNAIDFNTKYSLFYHQLLETGYVDDWNEFVYSLARYDDNIWTRSVAKKEKISDTINNRVLTELEILKELSNLNSDNIIEKDTIKWGSQNKDISITYQKLTNEIFQKGFGIWGKYDAFIYNDNTLSPIPNPPKIDLNSLIGFKYQQEQIINNTRAFIEGKPANNVLITGDRGAGKSSTVCGVFNMFKGQIKLIELPLPAIKDINTLIDSLKTIPHRFIIFIDDLVVDKDNINAFYPLKAALEGSMLGKSPNVLIYATSNRRHLIKESFKEREDDVHKSEGLEDTLALSDRFGLNILYQNLNKQEYLDLISNLAATHNIKVTEQLKLDAEKWAIIKAVHSPRTAVQFINNILSGIPI
ncbi:MAG TPA: DUF815 domain-containing protein [Clostridia bacterium]